MRKTRWSNRGVRVGQSDHVGTPRKVASLPLLEAMEPRLLLTSVAAFAPAVDYPTDDSPASIALGDFNHDGKPDLVTANESGGTLTAGSISILLGNGDGTFQAKTDLVTDVDPTDVVVGDFNHDGKDDIAVVTYGGDNVNLFLGNGNGTFQAKRSFAASGSPTCIAVGDFNGDGTDDLAVGSQTNNQISVYISDGSGGFTKTATCAVISPMAIAVGDFGNGHDDMAVASQTNNGSVAVLLGNGNGTFQAKQEYPVGESPNGVTLVDSDHDGHLDLAVTSYANSTVCILLGTGTAAGTFGTETEYATGGDPAGLAAADLDLDGNLDLGVVSWGGDTVSVMRGDGGGGFAAQAEELSVGSEPTTIVIGDFNADGRPDLAVADKGGASVSVLLNVGATSSDSKAMVNESATFKFTLASFTSHFVGWTNGALAQVTITSLPSHGTLKLKNVAVRAGDHIAAGDLKSLTYIIAPNYVGSDSFAWQGNDGQTNSPPATITLITTPEATIAAGANAVEGGAGSSFTVSLNHASIYDVAVTLTTSGKAAAGKNYVKLPKSVTIPAGQTSAQVALTPIVDHVAKGDLAVIASVGAGKNYTAGAAKSATILILDDEPKISITAAPATTTLGGAHGVITFARTGNTSQALPLTLTVKGTAKAGKDYTKLPLTVQIDIGQSSVSIDVVALLAMTTTKTVQVSAKATKDFSLDPAAALATVALVHV